MRNGQNQNKRMRGRTNNNNNNNHHRKNQNPMARVFESNGPDVKIRGNPSHIAEKYVQLARDAQTSGDPISAENYFQHAEHYYRLIASAQEQFRQSNPNLGRPDGDMQGNVRDDGFDDGDEGEQPMVSEAAFGAREPQPYMPREPQPYMQRDTPRDMQRDTPRDMQRDTPRDMPRDAQPFQQPYHQPPQHNQQHQPRHSQPVQQEGVDIERLPSFITGGQPVQAAVPVHQGQNGHESPPDRYPLHRRRRRHRGGPRQDFQGGSTQSDEPPPRD
ncbi:MAG TPA: DUF4167 domain-containing protein [Xanthobacteraceae bacterium]|nr:DUF4167 domain-containing protein [Xanthobacteraceae bacterium]